MYRKGAVDEAAFGLVSQKAQSFDNIFVDEVRKLTKEKNCCLLWFIKIFRCR